MRSDRQGAAAVEFAMVAPILCLMILGTIELGRAIQVQMALTNAVREGCRGYADSLATLPSGYQAGTDTYARYLVLDSLSNANLGINPAGVAITTNSTPVTVSGLSLTRVTVTAAVPYAAVSFFPPFIVTGNLTATVAMNKSR